MHPVIALTIAQGRQADLIAESHSRVLSSTARRKGPGLIERARCAIGEATYPSIELPPLTNYPYRP